MAAAAQTQTTPTATDPVQRWLARRSACPQLDAAQLDAKAIGSPAPSLPAPYSKAQRSRRAATNRANSALSTGPRTEPGKQRSSLNALRHGLTAQTAVLPTEDPDAYQRHIQQFLDEYAPATPTETQLVHEIANTAWRLNRIPFLEAELLSHDSEPRASASGQETPYDIVDRLRALATLGLHGSRLSRQFQKAFEQLRDIQNERRHLERRHLNEAAEAPHTPSAQRTSLGSRGLFKGSWLRFFKRTSRAPRTTPDSSKPGLLRPHAPPPGSCDAHGNPF